MSQDVFSGYSAQLVHGSGTLNLRQLRGVDKSTGKALSEVIAGGDLDRKAVILSHADPKVMITCADLATLIGVISPTLGLKITASSTFWLQKRLTAAGFDGGNLHQKVTTTEGFLCLDTISAQQDDNNQGASAECAYWPHSSDGLTEPLVVANAQALGATTPQFGSQFYLGPVYLDATELEGVQASKVQFGLDYKLIRASGDVFARKGHILRRRPVIQITFDKTTNVTTSALFSAAISGTLAVYFRKGVHGGSRVADNVGSHVKVSLDAGEWGAENLSWKDDESGSLVLQIMPTTTLSLSVASTIP